MLVTQYGIAVNPTRPDLEAAMKAARLPVKDIRQLRDMAVALNGPAKPYARTSDRVVANVLARDGSLQDVIYQVK